MILRVTYDFGGLCDASFFLLTTLLTTILRILFMVLVNITNRDRWIKSVENFVFEEHCEIRKKWNS